MSKKDKFGWAAIAMYLGFFGCIATACVVTKTGWPLFALIFTPDVTWPSSTKGKDNE